MTDPRQEPYHVPAQLTMGQQQYSPPQQPPIVQYPQTQQSIAVFDVPNVQAVSIPNYAVLSWLACLLCCCPIGIAAIIKSSEVNRALAVNDVPRAYKASDAAKKLAIAAIICGLILIPISVVLRLMYTPKA
ncbi:uncharacterized protein LOC130646310 [Hydractinia symbiolongicarpus]|uniref:uncharacterized protein LOC130646310 n=1 Tax=Hydractinia symbiolongicarpus TaxID=13093 RepID=UPI00254BC747|nr:uncharacterized protein LOC130646310 [Hydractinia symbiolongicarpus]